MPEIDHQGQPEEPLTSEQWEERWARIQHVSNKIIFFRLMLARAEEEGKEELRAWPSDPRNALEVRIIMPEGTSGQTSRAYQDQQPATGEFRAYYPQDLSSARLAYSDEIGTWLEIFDAPDLIKIEPIITDEPGKPAPD